MVSFDGGERPTLAALFLTKNAASFSQEDLNEQACDFGRSSGSACARLCHAFTQLGRSRLAPLGLGMGSRCERPCRAPLRLVRLSALLPSLCLLLRLSLRLLPLLARTLLARLVLGTRASKAPQQLQRAIPKLGNVFTFYPSQFSYVISRSSAKGLSCAKS